MLKRICPLLLILSGPLMAVDIPILTLNHEIGTRYQYAIFEDEDIDYLIPDGYNFNKGYVHVSEDISKSLSFGLNFDYSLRNYDLSTNLNNNSFMYLGSFKWEIIKNLDLGLGFKWETRTYTKDGSRDIEGFSPLLNLGFSPKKLFHLGLDYNLLRKNALSYDGDYFGNRFNIWYEQRIIPQMDIRLRYHFENRDYDANSAKYSDSYKHSLMATVKIDLNKTGEK